MRTKNARAIDTLEAEHMALVKSCRCVFCECAPPVEAHHVRQGRHFCTVAACKTCHDTKAWRLGHPNEFDAINETNRRFAAMRSGREAAPAPGYRKPRPQRRSQGSTATPSKIVPRKIASAHHQEYFTTGETT